jgi:hypothetical protein
LKLPLMSYGIAVIEFIVVISTSVKTTLYLRGKNTSITLSVLSRIVRTNDQYFV